MMLPHVGTLTLSLPDETATRRLAERFAEVCRAGDVLLLRGPLGAGKTTFVDGFSRALGAGAATSPTFVIAHSYPSGRIPLWHLDLYRISGQRAIEEVDLEQYIAPAAITLVEWPEHAPNMWPKSRIEIAFHIGEPGRVAQIVGFGDSHATVAALTIAHE